MDDLLRALRPFADVELPDGGQDVWLYVGRADKMNPGIDPPHLRISDFTRAKHQMKKHEQG